MAIGTILRFDDVRGYGFIEPADGTEDVFVHANDFGDSRAAVRAGLRVQYEVAQSDRGPKVATVSLLGPLQSSPNASVLRLPAEIAPPQDEAEDVCDVFSKRAFNSAVCELLIESVPSLTGAQIAEIRCHFAKFAQSHGWVDG
jgi:CspA family cold shock protein